MVNGDIPPSLMVLFISNSMLWKTNPQRGSIMLLHYCTGIIKCLHNTQNVISIHSDAMQTQQVNICCHREVLPRRHRGFLLNTEIGKWFQFEIKWTFSGNGQKTIAELRVEIFSMLSQCQTNNVVIKHSQSNKTIKDGGISPSTI